MGHYTLQREESVKTKLFDFREHEIYFENGINRTDVWKLIDRRNESGGYSLENAVINQYTR